MEGNGGVLPFQGKMRFVYSGASLYLLGRGGRRRGVNTGERERGRERGNSGLKTVKFKLKGQDRIQVLLPLSSPPPFLSSAPARASPHGMGVGLRLGVEGSSGQRKGEKVRESQTGLKFLLSCVLVRRWSGLALWAGSSVRGPPRHGSWLTCKFSGGVDGESQRPRWVREGVAITSGLLRERRLRGDLGVRGGGSRPPEAPGSAAWAWLGGRLLVQRLSGWKPLALEAVGSAALLQALAALAFQLTLPPLNQGILPERKREPAGPRPVWGSRVPRGKPGH